MALATKAVLNIYVTEYFCNIQKEVAGHHKHYHEVTAEESSNHHNNDKEAEEHHHVSNESSAEHHHNKESKDDNCCNDKTSSFYASLSNYTTVTFNFNNLSSIFIAAFSTFELPFTSDIFSQKCFCDKSPPPKIADFRVFIHSLLI